MPAGFRPGAFRSRTGQVRMTKGAKHLPQASRWKTGHATYDRHDETTTANKGETSCFVCLGLDGSPNRTSGNEGVPLQ